LKETLTRLEVLNLSNNYIEEIPSSLSKLFQLQKLNLSNNKINEKSIQIISELIQKSKKIVFVDLRSKTFQFYLYFFISISHFFKKK